MDKYYETWSIPKLSKEILDNVKNAVPWDLTFAPTANLNKEQIAELQKHLKYHFEIWANTWIVPQTEAILAKTRSTKGG